MHVRWRWGQVLAWLMVAVLAAMAAACTGDEPLPSAADLLRRSAAEIRNVHTVHFVVKIEGALGPLSIRSAEGVLTDAGDAEGTVTFDQNGALVEYEVIAAEGRFYLKGPTGGYQEIPAALVGASFDLASLLDPDEGVAAIVASATNGQTVAEESLNGTKAYRVRAEVNVGALAQVLPPGAEKPIAASLWIGADRPLLLRVSGVLPATGEEQESTVTVTLDRVNEPVTITAPSV
jgi:lipoprotein LprG